jgi:hypothetical protein
VEHRVPLKEDCAAVGKPGKLIVSTSFLFLSMSSLISVHTLTCTRAMRRLGRTHRVSWV